MKKIPSGFELCYNLIAHTSYINHIAWSPDGRLLASSSNDHAIRVWERQNGNCIALISDHEDSVFSVEWSPSCELLASASRDKTVRIWDARTYNCLHLLDAHFAGVNQVVWSPSSDKLASASYDQTIRLWDTQNGQCLHVLAGHLGDITSVAWSPDGVLLASASYDNNIRLWDTQTGQCVGVLEGHTSGINKVIWLPDGQRIISASEDKTIIVWNAEKRLPSNILEGYLGAVKCASISHNGRWLATSDARVIRGDFFTEDFRYIETRDIKRSFRLWYCDDWTCVSEITVTEKEEWLPILTFNRLALELATTDNDGRGISIWRLNEKTLLEQSVAEEKKNIHYVTAKIVLLGEAGVGKTGLGWRLAYNEFKQHPSTHGQQFWMLDQLKLLRIDGTECEAVLWDLAGQPDYRIIHGLFLDDADLAILLFDPTDSQEPLRGVEFWLKTFWGHLSHRTNHNEVKRKIILVAARIDRGDATLTQEYIEEFCIERGITAYVRTSASSGYGVAELIKTINAHIEWDRMAATTTTAAFKRIKEFTLNLKEDPNNPDVLVNWETLESKIIDSYKGWSFTQAEIQTAVGHLARQGYVKMLRTSSGRTWVLVHPSLLNNLAASFILEARRNPKGLGSLDEKYLLEYRFPELDTLNDFEKKTLLDAAVVLFIESHIAFRESHGSTSYLIFPALINQRKPLLGQVETFEDAHYNIMGSIENIYSALVVLLGYTNIFTRTDQLQHQAQYEVGEGEICGIRQCAEHEGELSIALFYNAKTSESSQNLFQGLCESFLLKHDVEIIRYNPAFCKECQERQDRETVIRRLKKGKDFMFCSECGGGIDISGVEKVITLSYIEGGKVVLEVAIAAKRTQFEVAMAWVISFVKKRGSFIITEESLGRWKAEGVPNEILKKLERLKGQQIMREEKFLAFLDKIMESFIITEGSLERWKAEGVPNEILKKLERLKGQQITGEIEFVDFLNKTIGDKQAAKFKSLIVAYAKAIGDEQAVKFKSLIVAYAKCSDLVPPSCFISYAWGNSVHENWVRKFFARDLQKAGINVILDYWQNTEIGSDIERFISLIETADSVILVGTPSYLEKYEQFKEDERISNSMVIMEMKQIFLRLRGDKEKTSSVKPVLLEGKVETSLPFILRGHVYADFRKEESYFECLFDLILSLYDVEFSDPAVIDLREKIRDTM